MKKLKLDLKDVGEILTREQLKQVVGGGSGERCFINCKKDDGENVGHIEVESCPTQNPVDQCPDTADKATCSCTT